MSRDPAGKVDLRGVAEGWCSGTLAKHGALDSLRMLLAIKGQALIHRLKVSVAVLHNYLVVHRECEIIFARLFDEVLTLNLERQYIRSGSAHLGQALCRLVFPLALLAMLKPTFALAAIAALASAETTSLSSSTSSSTSPSSTSSSSESPTLVWLTGTDAQGFTTVTQGIYTPTFMASPALVSEVSSGLIGVGSLSDMVGKIREYSTGTVNGGVTLGASGSFALMCALLAL